MKKTYTKPRMTKVSIKLGVFGEYGNGDDDHCGGGQHRGGGRGGWHGGWRGGWGGWWGGWW